MLSEKPIWSPEPGPEGGPQEPTGPTDDDDDDGSPQES
jgi:hypothetical protein